MVRLMEVSDAEGLGSLASSKGTAIEAKGSRSGPSKLSEATTGNPSI